MQPATQAQHTRARRTRAHARGEVRTRVTSVGPFRPTHDSQRGPQSRRLRERLREQIAQRATQAVPEKGLPSCKVCAAQRSDGCLRSRRSFPCERGTATLLVAVVVAACSLGRRERTACGRCCKWAQPFDCGCGKLRCGVDDKTVRRRTAERDVCQRVPADYQHDVAAARFCQLLAAHQRPARGGARALRARDSAAR